MKFSSVQQFQKCSALLPRCTKNAKLHFLSHFIEQFSHSKIRRGPKLEGCAFANFGNSSGSEEEPIQKREKNGEKKKNNQCCRDQELNPGPDDN